MKIKSLIAAVAASAFLFTACEDLGLMDSKTVRGTGAVERFQRDAAGFKGISVGLSANVIIRQGTAYKVEIETQKNIADVVETTVENGILEIDTKSGIWNLTYDKLNIYIETPTLTSLDVSSSGDTVVETPLKTDNLDMGVSGSGSIKMPQGLTAQNVEIGVSGSGSVTIENSTLSKVDAGVSGSGNVNVSGTAENADFSTTGSGSIKATKLIAKNVIASTSGSGDIRCVAMVSLDGSASGSGSILYAGDATQVKTATAGSGEVKKTSF
jgi:hypothetical protein